MNTRVASLAYMKELMLLIGTLLFLSATPVLPNLAQEVAPTLFEEVAGLPVTADTSKADFQKEELLSENAFAPELFVESFHLAHVSHNFHSLLFVSIHIIYFRGNSPPTHV